VILQLLAYYYSLVRKEFHFHTIKISTLLQISRKYNVVSPTFDKVSDALIYLVEKRFYKAALNLRDLSNKHRGT
jgi:hypothetical protein